MARPGITREQVIDVANQLQGQGIQPTIEQIRQLLGTGSNTTIAGFLKEWRVNQQKGINRGIQDLPTELLGVMKGLWARVQEKAQEQLTEASQEFQATIEKENSIKSQLQDQIKSLTTTLQNGVKENVALTQALNIATDDLASKKTEIQTLNAALVAINKDLDAKSELITELKRLNKQVERNLEHYREQVRIERLSLEENYANERHELNTALHQLREANHQLEINLEVAKQLNNTLSHDHHTLQHNYAKIEQSYNDLSVSLNQITHEKRSLNNQLDTLTKALLKCREEVSVLTQECECLRKYKTESVLQIRHWEERYAKANHSKNELKTEHLQAEKQLAVLSQQLHEANATIKKLEVTNQVFNQEKWTLAQEKAQLIGELKQLRLSMPTKKVV